MIRFGTGGWRAVIGDDFIRENIQKVAAGVCALVRQEGCANVPVVIGYDRRFLSSQASVWIAEVLCAHGICVHLIGRSTPTPLIMYLVKEKGYRYGLEVTASHNPSQYNGIKLIVPEGRDASAECTAGLEKLIDSLPADEPKAMPLQKAADAGLVQYLKNPFNDYIDSIMNSLDTEAIRSRGLRILFDPMHGSGAYPLNTVLTSCRCTIDLMNSNKDAFFGGMDPAPGASQLTELRHRVICDRYDLGIALDGDGDRLGIIAPDGEYLSANKILVMLYYYLHEYKGWRGPVVRNLATTHMLDRVAAGLGEKCYEVPVGFKWISARMDEVDAVLGGESSGGLTVRGHIHGKDSVYAGSLFVEMVSKIGKPLSAYWSELERKFGHFCMEEENLRLDPEVKERIRRMIMETGSLPDFADRKILRVSYEDGCKVYFENAFIICRFSGTEPLLRIFAEDTKSAGAKELIKCWIKHIKENLN